MPAPIRFINLPPLLRDMKRKGWIIDSFLFNYNKVDCIVILTVYDSENDKPSKHAIAKIEFLKVDDITNIIDAYVDFYELHFLNAINFYNFFNINQNNHTNSARQVFIGFSKYFAQFIPTEKIVDKDNAVEKRIISSRLDVKNPNARYCYDIRRSGMKLNGEPKERTIENSNKAELERSTLYEIYKRDKTLSFYFSDSFEDHRTDEEIMTAIARRN